MHLNHISTLSHSEQLKQLSCLKPQLQSINKLYPNQQGSQCNYCKKQLSYSYGLTNQQFSPYTYEILMERGWRRCGLYYYKMDMEKTCCKQWTHRMDVNQFKIKKDQKKTVKKVITIAYEPLQPNSCKIVEEDGKKNRKQSVNSNSSHNNNNHNNNNHHHNNNHHNNKSKQSNSQLQPEQKFKITIQVPIKYQQLISSICTSLASNLSLHLPTLIPAQQISQQHINIPWNFSFLQKLRSFTSTPQDKSDYYCNFIMLLYGMNKKKFKSKYSILQFVKDIKQYVQNIIEIDKKNQQYFLEVQRSGYLKIELCKKLKEEKSQEFQIIKEIQSPNNNQQYTQNIMKIQKQQQINIKKIQKIEIQTKNIQKMQTENDKQIQMKKKPSSVHFQKLQPEQFKGQLIITTDKITFGKLQILLVQAQADKQSFGIYENYCKQIHDKTQKVTLSSYSNFLCLKALKYQKYQQKSNQTQNYLPSFDPTSKYQPPKPISGTITKRLGCYHMKYYLQKTLIAVGVIDLLPHGLSSVYFFYSPQYKQKRLGVFSSIIQIQYIRYLSLTFPQFKYYYMGFYIHGNDKMSYKGDYTPFQLLCPITYNFIKVDDRVKELLNNILQKKQKCVRLAEKHIEKDNDMIFKQDLGVYIDKNIKLKQKSQVKSNQSLVLYTRVAAVENVYTIMGKRSFLNIYLYVLRWHGQEEQLRKYIENILLKEIKGKILQLQKVLKQQIILL